MFLTAEGGIQLSQHWFLFDCTTASFVGAAMSGYVTGFVAATSEWKKVLSSQRPEGRTGAAISTAVKTNNLMSVLRRLNAAATRNSVFDATFFGYERSMARHATELIGS